MDAATKLLDGVLDGLSDDAAKISAALVIDINVTNGDLMEVF